MILVRSIARGALFRICTHFLLPCTMKSISALAGIAGLASALPSALVASRSSPPSYSSKPVAHIKNGTVEGYHQSTYNHDYFLGVPFAQPPVDQLRFRNPQSINSTLGTVDATAYAPECLGYGVSSV
jgi:hypothetical protein